MAQAVSRWPLTEEAPVRCRVSSCGICDEQSGTGAGFSPCSLVFLVSLHTVLIYHLRDEQ
jgi:hypothetical protein